MRRVTSHVDEVSRKSHRIGSVQPLGVPPAHPDKNPVVCRSFSQVLNILVRKGKLDAFTTTPSLLQFNSLDGLSCDRTGLGKKSVDNNYLKTCETRGEIDPEKPLTRRISCDLTLFWTIIVIIIVSISTWILLKLGAFYIIQPGMNNKSDILSKSCSKMKFDPSATPRLNPVNTSFSVSGSKLFRARHGPYEKKYGKLVSV